MRRDYGDWKPAIENVVTRLEAGHWRHGIKTKDAVREVLRYARFPSDTGAMWAPRFRKRCGDFLEHALYYWVQGHLKDRRGPFVGASGKVYRVRQIHNVEHGNGNGELGPNGKPLPSDKEGLWLRKEDMHQADVRLVRGMYDRRRRDSGPDVVFLDTADRVLNTRTDDVVVGDVLDEIQQAL
jgi:hypothetical protein